MGSPSDSSRSTTRTSIPRSAQSSRITPGVPAARRPNVKLLPTVTERLPSPSTRTLSTNSSGSHEAIPASKGRANTASMPNSPASSARRSSGVRTSGWVPGRITSTGCGSNVTSTGLAPRSRAEPTAWSTRPR